MVTRAVDLAIGRLRKKIEEDVRAEGCILTIHGRGYVLSPTTHGDFVVACGGGTTGEAASTLFGPIQIFEPSTRGVLKGSVWSHPRPQWYG